MGNLQNQIEELVNAIDKAFGQSKQSLRCMFLIEAKKINPEISINDCRKHLGFYSEDEQEDLRLQSSFRNDIFNPTRDFLTKSIYNISTGECEEIWGRSASDQNKAKRERVLEMLPMQKRNRKHKPNQLELNLMQLINDKGYSLNRVQE